MDEPTSVLTPQEAELLFVHAAPARLRRRRDPLHHAPARRRCWRLPTAPPSCARGKVVGDRRSEAGERQEPRAHDGRRGSRRDRAAGARQAGREPRLVLDGLSLPADDPFAHRARRTSSSTCRRGRGRRHRGRRRQRPAGVLRRHLRRAAGRARRDDRDRRHARSGGRRERPAPARRGLRAGGAASATARSPSLRLSENVVLTRHGTGEEIRARPHRSIRGAARAVEERIGERFDVRRAERRPEGRRALRRQPAEVHHGPRDRSPARRLLVVNQPTWGVDAGAARAIRQALVDLARARVGRADDQPGPRRDLRDLRPRSPSCPTAGCRRLYPARDDDAPTRSGS